MSRPPRIEYKGAFYQWQRPATRHLWSGGRLVCSVTGDKGKYYIADALGVHKSISGFLGGH